MECEEHPLLTEANIRDAEFMRESDKDVKKSWEKMNMLMTVQTIWIPTKELVEARDLPAPLGFDSSRWDIAKKSLHREMHSAPKRPMAWIRSPSEEINEVEVNVDFHSGLAEPVSICAAAVLDHDRDPIEFARFRERQNPPDSVPDSVVVSREDEACFGPFGDMHSKERG